MKIRIAFECGKHSLVPVPQDKENEFRMRLRTPTLGRVLIFLTLLLPSLTVIYSRGPLVEGKLGLIDDHQFISYLNLRSEGVSLFGILMQTEIGDYPDGQRFRPTYYVLRIIETLIHGTNGISWYSTRLAIFALIVGFFTFLTFAVFWKFSAVSRIWSLAVAVVAGLGYASLDSFDDIVTRLGPSELYALLGTLVMVIGVYLAAVSNKRYFSLILIVVGWILAAGSKENFLIVGLLLLAPLAIDASRGKLRWSSATLVIVGFSFGLFIATGVFSANLNSGDIYGQSRGIDGLANALLVNQDFWIVTTLSIVSAVFFAIEELTKRRVLQISSLAVFPIISASETFFYQNELVNRGNFAPLRYGALTDLVLAITFLLLILSLARYLNRTRRPILQKSAILASLSIILLVASPSSFAQDYSDARNKVAYLNFQNERIIQVSDFLNESQVTQTLFIIDEPYDYERLGSAILYLNYYARETKVTHFAVADFGNREYPQVQLELASKLNQISKDGDATMGVSPIGELRESNLVCLHFGTEPASDFCSESVWVGG